MFKLTKHAHANLMKRYHYTSDEAIKFAINLKNSDLVVVNEQPDHSYRALTTSGVSIVILNETIITVLDKTSNMEHWCSDDYFKEKLEFKENKPNKPQQKKKKLTKQQRRYLQ